MKYVSLDLETSGLDPETSQILSIGLVIEDTNNIKPIDELPSLHIVIPRKEIKGDVFAINMNADLISLINKYNNADINKSRSDLIKEHGVTFLQEYQIPLLVRSFLTDNGFPIESNDSLYGEQVIMSCAGKNVAGFDIPFLSKLKQWDNYIKIHRRVLDPAILFVDWEKDDTLPNLYTCKKRAEVNGEVKHDALEDAKDVIRVLRTKYQ